MPAATPSSSRLERYHPEDRYASEYSSRRRRNSPHRGESSSRDNRYTSNTASSSSRHRSHHYDDRYDVRHSSSFDSDDWGRSSRNHPYEPDQSHRAPSPTWSDRHQHGGSSRHAYRDEVYSRGWDRSPSPDRRNHHRARPSRDYNYDHATSRRLHDDDWRRSDQVRRRSPDRSWDDSGPSRPHRREDDRYLARERPRSRSRSRSRDRHRYRDGEHRRSSKSHKPREEERPWQFRDRHFSRSPSHARVAGPAGSNKPLVNGEEGELEDAPGQSSARAGKLETLGKDRSNGDGVDRRRDEASITTLRRKDWADASNDRLTLPRRKEQTAAATEAGRDPKTGLSCGPPESSSLPARSLAAKVAAPSSAPDPGPSRPSPKSQTELPSPLDHSSPSHGGAFTPRPEMPSPATTVDSKATASTDDAKAAEDDSASNSQQDGATPRAARSAAANLNGTHPTAAPPTGPAAWRRITGERQRTVVEASGSVPAVSMLADSVAASPAVPTAPRAFRTASAAAAATAATAVLPLTSSSSQMGPPQSGQTATAAAPKLGDAEALQPSSPEQPLSAPSRPPVAADEVQPTKRSFGYVPLPNELDVEDRAKNYLLGYDPALSKDKAKGKYCIKRDRPRPSSADGASTVSDPRLGVVHGGRRTERGRKKFVPKVQPVEFYEWDKYSVGQRPLPPPRELLVTGLSARTTQGELIQLFRGFGRIEQQDLKLEPLTGQSLGVFSLTYAHDFDEDGKPLPGASAGHALQNGHNIAKAALKAMQGRRIGTEVITVSLDRNRTKYKLTYRQEAQRRIDARRRNELAAQGIATSTPAAAASVNGKITPLSSTDARSRDTGSGQSEAALPSTSMLPPPANVAPRAPRSLLNRPPATSSPFRGSPLQRTAWGAEPSELPRRTPASSSALNWKDEPGTDWRNHRGGDSYDRRPLSHSASRASHDTSSDRAREPRLSADDWHDNLGDVEESTERILRRLAELGNPYVYVAHPSARDIGLSAVRHHFSDFAPAVVTADERGFYVGFTSGDAASRARMVLDKKALYSYHLTVSVREAPDAESIRKEALAAKAFAPSEEPPTAADLFRRRRVIVGQGWSHVVEAEKLEYMPGELAEATFALIQKELAEHLIRRVRSHIVGQLVSDFIKPTGPGGQLMAELNQKRVAGGTMAASMDAKLPSFEKVAPAVKRSDLDFHIPKKPTSASTAEARVKKPSNSDRKSKINHRDPEAGSDDESASADERHTSAKATRASIEVEEKDRRVGLAAHRRMPDFSDDEEMGEPARSVLASVEPSDVDRVSVEPRSSKAKASKKKSSKKKSQAVALLEEEAEAEEETTTRDSSPAAIRSAAVKKSKPSKVSRVATPNVEPFSAGLAQDEEDLYYVKLALERHREGLPLTEAGWPADSELQLQLDQAARAGEGAAVSAAEAAAEVQQCAHQSGSARTEGFYKIPAADKAAHLPDRNKKSEKEAPNVHALASARNNRADSRRLVLGIEQHKKETASDTDIFKINQLRTRKKQLKFAKSPIHDWGLYAMEKILPGDMVIEYVGEVVRQQVADEREKQYERQGNFSTYLFRVDDDLVVDATHKGNIARLMNHCCTPNCNAKILTLNGEKRIVLFARTLIEPGDELTYDYKFQASPNDEDAIACLCDSPGCRRFL